MSASPVAFGAPKSPADRNRKRKPAPTLEAPRPRPALGKIALLVAGLGLGMVTALTITAETSSQLSAPGGLFTFAGSLTGMVGTYLALIMVLLVSRIPFVERVAGQDGLVRLHRTVAPWPISLLAAHAVFLTLGYAAAARTGAWHEAGHDDHQVPRRADRRRRPGHHVRDRDHLGARHPAAAAAGDLVADPPVDVPRPGARVPARDHARAVVRRAPAHPGRLVGHLGRHRGRGAVLPVRPARASAACGTGSWSPRCGPRGPAWCR